MNKKEIEILDRYSMWQKNIEQSRHIFENEDSDATLTGYSQDQSLLDLIGCSGCSGSCGGSCGGGCSGCSS